MKILDQFVDQCKKGTDGADSLVGSFHPERIKHFQQWMVVVLEVMIVIIISIRLYGQFNLMVLLSDEDLQV